MGCLIASAAAGGFEFHFILTVRIDLYFVTLRCCCAACEVLLNRALFEGAFSTGLFLSDDH